MVLCDAHFDPISSYTLEDSVIFIARHYYGAVFILFELSTPFLNLRNLLRLIGRDRSLLFRLSEASFTVTFFAVRVVFGLRMSAQVWSELLPAALGDVAVVGQGVALGVLAGNIVANGLNLFWAGTVVKMLAKRLTTAPR
mmetsp:Transcript_20562/g.50705  ORF Transcript_20562/g.50705 Transcript_20562/m.50705 type:complete len:140 (-) Transcript_20562:33-452(-)